MNKFFILILALIFSVSAFSSDEGKEFTKCVNVEGPDPIELEDFEEKEGIDEDDIFIIPKGWTPITSTSVTAAFSIILLCK